MGFGESVAEAGTLALDEQRPRNGDGRVVVLGKRLVEREVIDALVARPSAANDRERGQ
jgi:hypothetical protein